ncbi:hypothetical protein SAMN06297144_2884 [Sphingomonas guangdongensis]|uniref:Uncharacterized protein n=1 Tax=Sphingomonas guangdongensis TaxID=1141890 RepID=A0A285R1V3_9SPHN|nr:hypothetical protein [Sphingomonas guangdongensis]SOB87748.1 hypothetical protein SAMN06297144_2884 [Sphingomonas guangdongensis]
MRFGEAPVSGAERWAIGHLIGWRILATAAIGLIASRAILGWLHVQGIYGVAAHVATFLVMNALFFGVCAKAWFRAELPIAPAGWREGPRARIAVALLIVKASLWALLPLEVQLFISFLIAAARL